jgi:uroporphyrinogen-III synthase
MRVLITRPEREATALATALTERGHAPVIAPLFQLETLSPPSDFTTSLASAQAVLLSSANGARALAETTPQRSLRIFAVGDTTASTAEGVGFANVTSAEGDGAALARLVHQRLDAKAGPLLHVAGADVAADLGAALEEAGFTVIRATLYKARETEALPDSARAALEAHALDAATFFSPRGSTVFARLIEGAALVDSLRSVTAIAISPATAAALAALPFKTIVTAARPTRQAVLDEIDRLAQAGAQGPKPMSDTPSPAPASPARSSVPSSRSFSDTNAAPASARPSMPPPATPVVTVRRGLGILGAFVTGLVAAVVVLAAALVSLPHWPTELLARWRGAPPVAVVTQPPATPAGSDAATAARLDDIDKRVQALANTATAAAEKPTATSDPAVAVLRSRLDALEKSVAAGAEQAAAPATSPAAPSTPAPAAEPAPAEPDKDLAAVRLEIATMRAALQTLDQSVGAQKEETARQRERAQTLAAAVDKAVAASGERGAADQKAMAAARASAVIGIAARLSSAFDSGLPFAADLVLLAPLARDDGKLSALSAALQPFAQTGVASRAALTAEFPAMAKAALADDRADDSFGERLLGKVRGVVSLRRVGADVEGDTTEAKLARAEAALNAGDIAKAVELVKSLPPETEKARATWLARAEAHLAARRSVDQLAAYAATLLTAAR